MTGAGALFDLVVAANRLPVDVVVDDEGKGTWQRSPGGLVAAMEGALANREGAWVGWAGEPGPAPEPFYQGALLVHPVPLSAREVEEQCRTFLSQGCAGVDLLAYRATEAEPLDLIRAARRGLGRDGHLVVAGSIDSPARIRAVAEAGADGFTIGSAAFDGSFSARKGLLANQLKDILAACS